MAPSFHGLSTTVPLILLAEHLGGGGGFVPAGRLGGVGGGVSPRLPWPVGCKGQLRGVHEAFGFDGVEVTVPETGRYTRDKGRCVRPADQRGNGEEERRRRAFAGDWPRETSPLSRAIRSLNASSST